MKLSITRVALIAHILLGHSLAARVVTNAENKLETLEQGSPRLDHDLEARQVPINSQNDAPRDASPGGAAAPKDMQPKPNDNMPQPTPVVPIGTPNPKMPVPVPNPGIVKPPVAGRVVRRPRSYPDGQAPLNRKLVQRQAQRSSPPAPPPPPQQLPPHSGPPGNNDNDPVLPDIIPQPKIPGIPPPKVPVPVETDRPAPMALSGY